MGVVSKRTFGWSLKKLTDAARYWARQVYQVDKDKRQAKVDALAEKMKRLKAPQSAIDKVLAQVETEQDQFNVWPENHLAVNLFLLLQSQWERNPMDNSMQNIIWSSIDRAINRHSEAKKLNPEQQDQIFWDITAMERHAINEISLIKAEREEQSTWTTN